MIATLGSLAARIGDLPSWVVGLVVAGIGLGGAYLYFSDAFTWWWAVGAVALVAIVLLVASVGETRLPEAPLEAVRTMGWRTLAMLLMAGLGAAALIVIAARIVSPEEAPAEQEELVKGIAAALAAAVTASLVKASEGVDAASASAAQSAFEKAYEGEFAEGSDGRRAVYDDGWQNINGWGRTAREKRAAIVKVAWDSRKAGGTPTRTP